MNEQESTALLLILMIQTIEVTEVQEQDGLNSDEERLWEQYAIDRKNSIPPTWEEFCAYSAIYLYKLDLSRTKNLSVQSWGEFRAQTRGFWYSVKEAFGLKPSQVFLLTTAILNPMMDWF